MTVNSSTFSGNGSIRGGAIDNNRSTLAVSNSTFSGNSATYGAAASRTPQGRRTVAAA